MIYRDPIDSVVSYFNYVFYSHKSQNSPGASVKKKFLTEKFSNDDERLAHVITERRIYPFLEYAPWLDNPWCHAVRFEDLYRDVLNMETGVLGETFSNLLTYLEIEQGDIDAIDFYNMVYNKGRTASNETNKIGLIDTCYGTGV